MKRSSAAISHSVRLSHTLTNKCHAHYEIAYISKATVAQITMDVTNRFVNCNPQVRLKRMEDVTHRSLDKAQKYEKAETEVVSAAENIIGIAGFLSSLVAAFPPVAMAITGISAVLPVRFSPCLSSRILRDPN